MNIKFLEPKTEQEWDNYVLQLENHSFLLSSARYQYLKQSSVDVFRYLVFDNNKFVGIILGTIDSVKIFGRYIECKHNPMLIKGLDKKEKEFVLKGMIEKLEEIGKENNCFLLRISPLVVENEQFQKIYTAFQANKAPVQPQDALISQYFDTTKELEILHREMNKSSRSNVNKLLKDKDITVKIVRDDSVFNLFKNFYTQTKNFKGYRGKSADKLLKEFREYINRDMLYFLIVYTKDEPVSIWQLIKFGKYMHHYQAGSDLKFREKNVRLLFWRTLELCKEIGVETLDLFGGMLPEGVEDLKNPWRGINDFKMSLGGKKVTYMHPRDIPLKPYYSIYLPYAKFRVEFKGHTTNW